jgi:hypothetical protein
MSLSIVKVVKDKRLCWVGHVVRMGEGRNTYTVSVRKPVGKCPLEPLGSATKD